MKTFYVYVVFHPVSGQPIYVGKGSGKRWMAHERNSPNRRLDAVIRKHGTPPVAIVREGLIEADAFALEVALIAAIGRAPHAGPLLNGTHGGEGPARGQRAVSAHLTLYLDDKRHAALARMAKDRGRSIHSLILEGVDHVIGKPTVSGWREAEKSFA